MIFIIVMTQERPVIFRLLPRPWSSLQRQIERESEIEWPRWDGGFVFNWGWWTVFLICSSSGLKRQQGRTELVRILLITLLHINILTQALAVLVQHHCDNPRKLVDK